MKIIFTKETIHSSKKEKDFYVVRYILINDKKEILAKSEPLLWLTKEVYDSLDF